MRIDGLLHLITTVSNSLADTITSRIKVMAGMNIAESRRPQDGQFAFQGEHGEVDVRVATADTARGPGREEKDLSKLILGVR